MTQTYLSGQLANLVYSMGITQTGFYAHQHKLIMRLLDSPANVLLIADEVGLGKTIEAGFIWTELRTRSGMLPELSHLINPTTLNTDMKENY